MIVYEILAAPLTDKQKAMARRLMNQQPRLSVDGSKAMVTYCDSNGRPYGFDSELYTEEQIRAIMATEEWTYPGLVLDV